MPNPFGKSRPTEEPYAIYVDGSAWHGGNITWHVIKTYKMPKSELKDPYARWMVAAKSEATFGSFELGDTYAADIKRYGQLVAADPAWIEAYGGADVPTVQEYLALQRYFPATWMDKGGKASRA
tara:strand:+ start:394 stop:765 length:372 start_codon:yes stop_codon:yes gene_type:complete